MKEPQQMTDIGLYRVIVHMRHVRQRESSGWTNERTDKFNQRLHALEHEQTNRLVDAGNEIS